MRICMVCKSELPDNAKFCTECGADLRKQKVNASNEPPKKICPKCGATATGKSKFCTKCGAELLKTSPNGVAADAPKDATVNASKEPPKNVCPKCGAEMTGKSKFCTKCGAEMGKKLVKNAENVGKLINGIMEFTSQASDNPGETVISNYKSKIKF